MIPAWLPLLAALAGAVVFALGNLRARRALGRATWVFGRSDSALDFVGKAHRVAIALSAAGLAEHAVAPTATSGLGHAALGWVGTVAMALGAAVLAWAQRAMGRSWRIGIPEEATELVTTGPFALSRNPAFLSFMLLLGGAAAAVPGPLTAAGAAAGFVAFSVQIRLEEAHLAARHGAAHEAYARRVGRWLGQWGGGRARHRRACHGAAATDPSAAPPRSSHPGGEYPDFGDDPAACPRLAHPRPRRV